MEKERTTYLLNTLVTAINILRGKEIDRLKHGAGSPHWCLARPLRAKQHKRVNKADYNSEHMMLARWLWRRWLWRLALFWFFFGCSPWRGPSSAHTILCGQFANHTNPEMEQDAPNYPIGAAISRHVRSLDAQEFSEMLDGYDKDYLNPLSSITVSEPAEMIKKL